MCIWLVSWKHTVENPSLKSGGTFQKSNSQLPGDPLSPSAWPVPFHASITAHHTGRMKAGDLWKEGLWNRGVKWDGIQSWALLSVVPINPGEWDGDRKSVSAESRNATVVFFLSVGTNPLPHTHTHPSLWALPLRGLEITSITQPHGLSPTSLHSFHLSPITANITGGREAFWLVGVASWLQVRINLSRQCFGHSQIATALAIRTRDYKRARAHTHTSKSSHPKCSFLCPLVDWLHSYLLVGTLRRLMFHYVYAAVSSLLIACLFLQQLLQPLRPVSIKTILKNCQKRNRVLLFDRQNFWFSWSLCWLFSGKQECDKVLGCWTF